MNIDSPKLIRAIKLSDYGTGTLSTKLQIHPDVLHKIIDSGECTYDLFIKLCKTLNTDLGVAEAESEQDETPQPEVPLQVVPESEEIEEEVIQDEIQPPETPELTQVEILRANNGVIKLRQMVVRDEVSPELLLRAEEAQNAPRQSLTNWLRDRIERYGNSRRNQSS